jgi:hypothetical protein
MSILIIIAALIVLLLVIALFSKKGYSIQRDIVINRPKQEVFDYIKLLKNQDHFSKWVMTDPNMKKVFTGTDGTVGFVYAWEGNKKAGKGEQEIMKIAEGERLDVEVRFIKPFEGIAQTPFITTAVGNQTKLTWGMTSSMKYPMNIMLLFLSMEKMLGKDLEISLTNLKTILER